MSVRGIVSTNLAPFFQEKKGMVASRCWLAFLGNGDGDIQTDHQVDEVKYTIQRSKRGMAKLFTRSEVTNRLIGSNQKNRSLGNFTEVSRSFPLSIEEYDIVGDQLTRRLPNEPVENSGVTRHDRARYYAAMGQTDLMVRQANLINKLAGQAILEGKQDAVLGTSLAAEQYDFYRHEDCFITLDEGWGSASGTPLEDLDDAIDVSIHRTGMPLDGALLGSAAIQKLTTNKQVTGLGDNRSLQRFVDIGEISMGCPKKFDKLLKHGWECRGKVTTLKGRNVWLFTTEELEVNIEDETQDDVSCMPTEEVALFNVDSRVDGHFGPPGTLGDDSQSLALYRDWFGFIPGLTPSGQPQINDGVIRPDYFYLDAYKNEHSTAITLRSQSAPLIVPVNTDSWIVISNAGTDDSAG